MVPTSFESDGLELGKSIGSSGNGVDDNGGQRREDEDDRGGLSSSMLEEDEECVCGRRARCCCRRCRRGDPAGWCPCCCCCKVRLRHVPEIVLLSIWLLLAVLAVVTTPPTFIVVGIVRNILLGFFFMCSILVYVPIFLASYALQHTGFYEENKGSIPCVVARYFVESRRFRAVANALYLFSFIMTLTFCVFVVMPEAYDLDAKMSTLGPSTNTPFAEIPPTHSFANWAFKGLAPWGKYGSHSGGFRSETFVYKTGFPASPKFDDCDSRSRSYRPYLELEVHYPDSPSDGRLPPILFHTHGGGWTIGDMSTSAWSFSYFLDRGFAIVSAQYSLACYGYSALEMLDDLKSAFYYVQANAASWGFDASRVHFVGGSAGGHLALLTAYNLNQSSVRSVFNLYGVTDWTDFLSCKDQGTSTSGYGGGLAFTLANRSCTREALEAISPVHYVDAATPLTVTFHGTLDSLVPFKQAKRLHDALDASSVPNVLVPLETFDHVPEIGYHGITAQMHRYVFMRLLSLARWD